ncbi:hypothetical protein MRX96_059521 [Rhipicephalus microplus]
MRPFTEQTRRYKRSTRQKRTQASLERLPSPCEMANNEGGHQLILKMCFLVPCIPAYRPPASFPQNIPSEPAGSDRCALYSGRSRNPSHMRGRGYARCTGAAKRLEPRHQKTLQHFPLQSKCLIVFLDMLGREEALL